MMAVAVAVIVPIFPTLATFGPMTVMALSGSVTR